MWRTLVVASLMLWCADVAFAQPPDASTLLDPAKMHDCSAWPDRRAYVESQAWWTDPGDDLNAESRHLHVGACLPLANLGSTVSTTLTLHVLVQLHNSNVSWDRRLKRYAYPSVGLSLFFVSNENTTWAQNIGARYALCTM